MASDARSAINPKRLTLPRRIRQDEADRLKAKAESLKDTAKLEDLQVWQMEKEKNTKKGPRTYTYWIASWREGDKVRNVHLGSYRKMDHSAAMLKAQKMKAEAMGLRSSE